jgi:hypothetical protein
VRAIDVDQTVIEIAGDRRRLQSVSEAIVDAQDLCARARLLVQESQELLRQVDDDLHRSGMGPVLQLNALPAGDPIRPNERPDVRYGSITDIGASPHHVRFTPKSGH